MGALDGFWATIAQQITELKTARNADDVLRILANERDPYRQMPDREVLTGDRDGFFAGSGGDDSVMEALDEAGWSIIWARADYYFAMRAPDGSAITYIEGDIYRGNKGSLP